MHSCFIKLYTCINYERIKTEVKHKILENFLDYKTPTINIIDVHFNKFV